MTSIYDQIADNKRRTFVVFFSFILVIAFLGYVLGQIYGNGGGIGTMVIATLFSSITAISTYYFSDKVVLGLAGATKVERKDYSQLYGILENLCIGAGIKKVPDLYVINDNAPNAFATGRDPEHSVVAVTTGLLSKLEKRELEGVLAHELSHIKNYDIRLMTFVVILVGMISIIGNIMFRRSIFRDNKNSGGLLVLIGVVFAILSPIVAQLIQLALSRSREYLADASAALLTRDPEGLALALEKISLDQTQLKKVDTSTSYLYIESPVKQKKGFGASSIFSTHPPVEERIKRLRSM